MLADEMNILSDESLVRMAQEGSSLAYELLIDKYKHTAKIGARKYYIAGAENEDVIQEAMIGIFKAIRDFDENAGAKFSTFLQLCMENQIKTAINAANRQKHKLLNESLSIFDEGREQVDFDGGDTASNKICGSLLADKDLSPEKLAMLKEAIRDIESGDSEKLSNFEREVWEKMRQGMNYREIATALGRTPKAVDNAMQRLKKKIRINLLDY